MKPRSLNRIARGLGWTAAVAGTLGLALPAAAQTPPLKGYRTAPVMTGRAPQAAPAPNAAVEDSTLRLVQARVQMAWLADPTTFSYALGLTAGPQGVQVSGFVPNEGVRQRAMQLARQHSGLPVIDGLKIHPNLTVRCVGRVSGGDLQLEAAEALRETFGDRAGKWQVTAGSDGRVTVAGPCATPDEQLEVARSLRRAGHCACVSTQLTIGELPTAMAMASPAPAVETPMAVPEPAPQKQTVVAWHPDIAAPAVEAPATAEAKADPMPALADNTPAKTDTDMPPTAAAPRLAPAGFYESPKMAGIDALPAVPAAEAKRAEGEVYETTGEIQWETTPAEGKNAVWSSNPDAKPAPAAPATGPVDAGRVQEAIRARCGADVREVRVEFLRDRRMHITVRVAPGADRGRVENEIRQIPDVAGYGRTHGYFID